MNKNDMVRNILPANEAIYKQAIAKLNVEKPLTDKEKFDKYMELSYQARAALRTETVNLKVRAKMIGLDFFELRELQPDEIPCYELDDTRPMIPVTVVSTFGGSATTVWSDNLSRVTFPLGYLESDKVRVQRFDLYQGFTNKQNKINQDITDSLNNQLDDMAWVAIAAGIGNLDSNVWILDPKIKNAPTSNFLDLKTICAGKITVDLFKAITEHFDRIGKPIRALYLPAARKSDLFDLVGVAGTGIALSQIVPPEIAAEIWRTGGLTGQLIPPIIFTNVLEGELTDNIFGYAVTNDAPGYFFQKPAFHTTDEKDEGIWHYAQTIITGSFVIPPYRKMNIAKIKIG